MPSLSDRSFLAHDDGRRWYVLRDLKRANALVPAYRFLSGEGLEVFTPLSSRPNGRGVVEERPVIHGLLFARGSRLELDPYVERTPTLQYRYVPGRRREPMLVPDAEMDRFIQAVKSSPSPRYYLPGEITPEMYGRRVRVVGGPLDGCEGVLLKCRGSRVRRLLVSLPGFLSVGVEVEPDYVQVL